MACFERNIYIQISGGYCIQNTTFCGDHVVDTTFISLTHYDITMGNYYGM